MWQCWAHSFWRERIPSDQRPDLGVTAVRRTCQGRVKTTSASNQIFHSQTARSVDQGPCLGSPLALWTKGQDLTVPSHARTITSRDLPPYLSRDAVVVFCSRGLPSVTRPLRTASRGSFVGLKGIPPSFDSREPHLKFIKTATDSMTHILHRQRHHTTRVAHGFTARGAMAPCRPAGSLPHERDLPRRSPHGPAPATLVS